MTVLQLILLGTHFLVGVIFYTDGKRTGYIEGRKAVRKHYESIAAREAKMNEVYNEKLINAYKDQK